MKTFHVQYGIGKSAKYVVNFHDGISTHKDGSPFFDMRIFHNKKHMNKFTNGLLKDGYRETTSLPTMPYASMGRNFSEVVI